MGCLRCGQRYSSRAGRHGAGAIPARGVKRMNKNMKVTVQPQPEGPVQGSDPRTEIINAAALPGAKPASETSGNLEKNLPLSDIPVKDTKLTVEKV